MITVFTTESCAYCKQVRRYLDSKDVPYVVEEATGEAYKRLSAKYGFSVPLIYNSEKDAGMVGYDIAKLKELVGV